MERKQEMKKLMIAAAAAAMIGGAYAEAEEVEFIYDFTASVKSTGGKSGKATTYTVNCGRDSYEQDAAWWWENVDCPEGVEEMTDVLAKSIVKKMTNEEKAALADELGYGYDEETGKWITDYNCKNQQGKWCYTFTFRADGNCYRVAKSYKIKAQVMAGCCGGTWESIDPEVECEITDGFLNFFGSQDYDKATKVEQFAEVGGTDLVAGQYDAVIAGQGSRSAKLYKFRNTTYWGIKSISGNIAGYKDAPFCVGCCGSDPQALAFECDDWELQEDLPTAIFGTYSLKFNKKASDEYNK